MLKDKSIIRTIVIGLIVITGVIALLVNFSQAGFVDNNANIYDNDLAWQIANWGVDTWFTRDANDLIGKELNVYHASSKNQATIRQKSAYCLNSHGQTEGGNIYKILNIIDVDVNMGDYIDGKPGITTVYGGSEGNVWSSTTGNKVTDDSEGKYASEGTDHAIELAYLAANAFANGETKVVENSGHVDGAYKLALQMSYMKYFNNLIKQEEEGGIGLSFTLKPDLDLTGWHESTRAQQEAAYNYAQKLKNYRFIDKSVKGQQSITYNAEKDITYIGPYQLGIQETTAEAFRINDGNIQAEGFTEYLGGDLVTDVKTLPNSKDFYIGIKGNKQNEIYNVQVISWTTSGLASARLAFLQVNGGQNLVLYGGKLQDKQAIVNLPLPSSDTLRIKKVDATTRATLANVGFKLKQDSTGLYAQQKLDGTITYVSSSAATEFKTQSNGILEIKGLQAGTYSLYETKNPNKGYQFDKTVPVISVSVPTAGMQVVENHKDQQLTLTIIKEGWNATETSFLEYLKDVEFIIQDATTDEYIAGITNGEIQYTTNINKAKKYTTNSKGKVVIEGLESRKYNIYEINNPNSNYIKDVVSYSKPVKTVYLSQSSKEVKIINRKRSNPPPNHKDEGDATISGYVWLDGVPENKLSTRDDVYSGEANGDKKLSGIKVVLMNGTNKVKSVTTNNEGEYEFTGLSKSELKKYHIEFEYDGLKYTSVKSNINIDSGSKASETSASREELNKKFNSIEGTGGYTGISKNSDNVKTFDLTYTEASHKAIDVKTNETPIAIASTDEAGFKISSHTTPEDADDDEDVYVKNVNLGLYIRPQPDLSLGSDIQSVKVVANGKEHVYEYSKRYNNQGELTSYGVEYEDAYLRNTYEAPVYRADWTAGMENNNWTSKIDFGVYVTYCINVSNESSVLDAKVNSIIDYFDERYAVIKIGTSYDKGNITGGEIPTPRSERSNVQGYSKIVIPTNMDIEHGKNNKIYVTFELDANAIDAAFSRGEEARLFRSVGEINSYSTYENGKIYAGVDVDSNPANTIPEPATQNPKSEDRKTYEDDTFAAPAFKLREAEARTVSGNVFEDAVIDPDSNGNQVLGDGLLDNKPISGVKVILKEKNSAVEDKVTLTDDNGNYEFTEASGNDTDGIGIIAGDYNVEFDWGINQGGYNVQNYKGTIYKAGGEDNDLWHLQEDTRYSDAIDDMETRKTIDTEIAVVNYKHTIDNKENYKDTNLFSTQIMDSTTPDMNIGIEDKPEQVTYAQDDGTIAINEYSVNNVDFGIVERPDQELDISKRVSHIKITLANGQVVTDAELEKDANGNVKLTGQKDHLTYFAPQPGSTVEQSKYGMIRAELDNELIQGAKLEITYTINVKNTSRLDYEESEYYKYGIKDGMTPIRMRASKIADYLDKEWAASEGDTNAGWNVLDGTEIENLKADLVLASKGREFVADTLGKTETEIDADGNMNISNLAQRNVLLYEDDTLLAPGENNDIHTLTVSKLLTTGEDINLNNNSEIIEITRTSGEDGIYGRIPGKMNSYDSETTNVTPSTGENRDITLPIALGTTALLLTAAGIVLIKKKVLK